MSSLYRTMHLIIKIAITIAIQSTAYLILILVISLLQEFISFFTSVAIGNISGFVMSAAGIEIAHRFHRQERAITFDGTGRGEKLSAMNQIHRWYNMFLFPRYIEMCKDKAKRNDGIVFVLLWCLTTALIPMSVVFVGQWFRLWELTIIPFGIVVIVAFCGMEALRWEATIKGEFRRREPY